MTIAFTYDDTQDLGRVQLTFSGYDTDSDYAKVERSLDQVTWETVRGGDTVALTAGAGHIDDYEFTANTLNYYRVTAVDSATPSWVGVGTAGVGNNASVSPALPAGLVNNDVIVLHAAIRNSGTGTVNLPAGWTSLVNTGNMLIAARVWTTGVTAPTVTFAGGVANADTLAIIGCMRNVTMTNAIIQTPFLNGSAQNISTPGGSYLTGDVSVHFGWKQDDCTSVAGPGGWSTFYTTNGTAGDDAMICAVGLAGRAVTAVDPVFDIVVTGGGAAISRAATVSFAKRGFTNQETSSYTPVVTQYRIKNPSRPSLNVKITPVDIGPISRTARTGIFEVLNRNQPVAVTDVMSSRKFELKIDINGYSARDDMDNRLSQGEPMFLQPPTQPGLIPLCFFVIDGDVVFSEDAKASGSYTVTIPCREVAKPGATVYGDTYIWNDVITDYATWTAVLAANATWSQLIDKVSTGSVIVP